MMYYYSERRERMKKKVATELRKHRKQLQLTGEDVVKELSKYGVNISPQTIYNYETSLRQPNADIFLYLCKIYNINDFDIFFDKSAKTKKKNSLYDTLNNVGKQKADEYIEDLTGNPKYIEHKSDKPTAVFHTNSTDDDSAPLALQITTSKN